jgi:hypothetical protein
MSSEHSNTFDTTIRRATATLPSGDYWPVTWKTKMNRDASKRLSR